MDWANFRFEFRISLENQFSNLIQTEANKEAALNLVLPSDWKEQLDQLNRVRAVHGTTAVEGNPLSEAEVSRLLATSSDEHATQSREEKQVRNAGSAQDWVRQRFTPGSRPLHLSDIMQLHRLVTHGSDEDNNVPGELRTHPVVVGTKALGGVHRGAPPADLRRFMEEFVAFVNSNKLAAQHPVVRALLAHFFLVTIHPFGDGNGRVSRLVEAGILFQGGYNVHGFYGLSKYFYRNGNEYMLLLQQGRRTQPFDLNGFIAFGIEGFSAELKGINNFIKTKLNRVIYRTTLTRARNQRVSERRRVINQREYDLLCFLLDETEPVDPFADEPSKKIKFSELLGAPYVAAVYRRVTTRTFLRELDRLEKTGFIKIEDRGEELIFEIDFDAIGRY